MALQCQNVGLFVGVGGEVKLIRSPVHSLSLSSPPYVQCLGQVNGPGAEPAGRRGGKPHLREAMAVPGCPQRS